MKRLFLVGLSLFFVSILSAQEALTLTDAIFEAAGEIQGRVRRNSIVAILDISSRSGRMSEHIFEELMAEIVNGSYATVVERDQIDLILDELEYQNDAGVSDRSAARAGRMLGAQYIVTGTFDQENEDFRLRIKVIEVESTAVRLMFNTRVISDSSVVSLMGRRGSSSSLTNDQQRILEIAEAEILSYFRRYKPKADIDGNKVHGEAKYGKDNVKIDVTFSRGDYRIDIVSTANAREINKWKATLKSRIDKKLGK
ncbi:MAG: penicillin-binding protein activator LpoB [Treponema sp.]|jgi:TolB-like protein|nr:penicillin-binding protein activator LpoB [Treponema sp.]